MQEIRGAGRRLRRADGRTRGRLLHFRPSGGWVRRPRYPMLRTRPPHPPTRA